MLIVTLPEGSFRANCYVVVGDDGVSCAVVDPGPGSAEMIADVLVSNGLTLMAVLLTHAHIDHSADAAKVADAHDVPVWVHSADRALLTRPSLGLNADFLGFLRQLGADSPREPARLQFWDGQDQVCVAGLSVAPLHAPGHTPGCTLLCVEDADSTVVLCGDVVFRGSVGRTDLPGGDPAVMRDSLREVVLTLPERAQLLPGHGPATTLGAERRSNPYLQPAFLEARP